MITTTRVPLRLGALAVCSLLLTACGLQTHTPASQDARLTKAAGIANISLLMPKSLWSDTKPYSSLDKVGIDELDGDRGARGLVRVNLTGTQVITYMKELDENAHPGWLDGDYKKESSARVYEAIGTALDGIKPARSASDPAPEVLIDDTLATPAP
ncbi:hypothetical protein ACFV1L_29655 [Kitasatospora sp. NPDC059646]|uniref:hypothetical protein n=1 Tax=Kitasatospora sp. NPDC059646 TaxID=3346893 RepID=UPI00369C269E